MVGTLSLYLQFTRMVDAARLTCVQTAATLHTSEMMSYLDTDLDFLNLPQEGLFKSRMTFSDTIMELLSECILCAPNGT